MFKVIPQALVPIGTAMSIRDGDVEVLRVWKNAVSWTTATFSWLGAVSPVSLNLLWSSAFEIIDVDTSVYTEKVRFPSSAMPKELALSRAALVPLEDLPESVICYSVLASLRGVLDPPIRFELWERSYVSQSELSARSTTVGIGVPRKSWEVEAFGLLVQELFLSTNNGCRSLGRTELKELALKLNEVLTCAPP